MSYKKFRKTIIKTIKKQEQNKKINNKQYIALRYIDEVMLHFSYSKTENIIAHAYDILRCDLKN